MIQPPAIVAWIACAVCAALVGCGREPAQLAATRPAQAGAITVASLSPAFTDLIFALGAADRLVAVSNFEPRDPPPQKLRVRDLPRVGDYRTIDWERLATIRPALILTQYRADKMPDGLIERAGEIGSKVVNLDIDTIADIETAMRGIGAAMELDQSRIDGAVARFNGDLEAVRKSVAARPPVKALVVIGETGLAAVGPKNFVDEILQVAGGENVLRDGPDFATLDRERLVALDPPVVIQLLPSASEQVIERASSFWREQARNVAAVRTGRVYTITDSDSLLPATNVPRLARRMADLLHGPQR